MRVPFFIPNDLFRGKRGGDTAYWLQNVMASQRFGGTRKRRVPGDVKFCKSATGTQMADETMSLAEYERRSHGWRKAKSERELRAFEARERRREVREAAKRAAEEKRWHAEAVKREKAEAAWRERHHATPQAPLSPGSGASLRWFVLFHDQTSAAGRKILTFLGEVPQERAIGAFLHDNPFLVLDAICPLTQDQAEAIASGRMKPPA